MVEKLHYVFDIVIACVTGDASGIKELNNSSGYFVKYYSWEVAGTLLAVTRNRPCKYHGRHFWRVAPPHSLHPTACSSHNNVLVSDTICRCPGNLTTSSPLIHLPLITQHALLPVAKWALLSWWAFVDVHSGLAPVNCETDFCVSVVSCSLQWHGGELTSDVGLNGELHPHMFWLRLGHNQ